MTPRSPFIALWGAPIALGLLSASGLATALVSETWGDWWAWVALGAPVAVMAWYAWRPQHTPTSATSHTSHAARDQDASTHPSAVVLTSANQAENPDTVSPSRSA